MPKLKDHPNEVIEFINTVLPRFTSAVDGIGDYNAAFEKAEQEYRAKYPNFPNFDEEERARFPVFIGDLTKEKFFTPVQLRELIGVEQLAGEAQVEEVLREYKIKFAELINAKLILGNINAKEFEQKKRELKVIYGQIPLVLPKDWVVDSNTGRVYEAFNGLVGIVNANLEDSNAIAKEVAKFKKNAESTITLTSPELVCNKFINDYNQRSLFDGKLKLIINGVTVTPNDKESPKDFLERISKGNKRIGAFISLFFNQSVITLFAKKAGILKNDGIPVTLISYLELVCDLESNPSTFAIKIHASTKPYTSASPENHSANNISSASIELVYVINDDSNIIEFKERESKFNSVNLKLPVNPFPPLEEQQQVQVQPLNLNENEIKRCQEFVGFVLAKLQEGYSEVFFNTLRSFTVLTEAQIKNSQEVFQKAVHPKQTSLKAREFSEAVTRQLEAILNFSNLVQEDHKNVLLRNLLVTLQHCFTEGKYPPATLAKDVSTKLGAKASTTVKVALARYEQQFNALIEKSIFSNAQSEGALTATIEAAELEKSFAQLQIAEAEQVKAKIGCSNPRLVYLKHKESDISSEFVGKVFDVYCDIINSTLKNAATHIKNVNPKSDNYYELPEKFGSLTLTNKTLINNSCNLDLERVNFTFKRDGKTEKGSEAQHVIAVLTEDLYEQAVISTLANQAFFHQFVEICHDMGYEVVFGERGLEFDLREGKFLDVRMKVNATSMRIGQSGALTAPPVINFDLHFSGEFAFENGQKIFRMDSESQELSVLINSCHPDSPTVSHISMLSSSLKKEHELWETALKDLNHEKANVDYVKTYTEIINRAEGYLNQPNITPEDRKRYVSLMLYDFGVQLRFYNSKLSDGEVELTTQEDRQKYRQQAQSLLKEIERFFRKENDTLSSDKDLLTSKLNKELDKLQACLLPVPLYDHLAAYLEAPKRETESKKAIYEPNRPRVKQPRDFSSASSLVNHFWVKKGGGRRRSSGIRVKDTLVVNEVYPSTAKTEELKKILQPLNDKSGLANRITVGKDVVAFAELEFQNASRITEKFQIANLRLFGYGLQLYAYNSKFNNPLYVPNVHEKLEIKKLVSSLNEFLQQELAPGHPNKHETFIDADFNNAFARLKAKSDGFSFTYEVRDFTLPFRRTKDYFQLRETPLGFMDGGLVISEFSSTNVSTVTIKNVNTSQEVTIDVASLDVDGASDAADPDRAKSENNNMARYSLFEEKLLELGANPQSVHVLFESLSQKSVLHFGHRLFDGILSEKELGRLNGNTSFIYSIEIIDGDIHLTVKLTEKIVKEFNPNLPKSDILDSAATVTHSLKVTKTGIEILSSSLQTKSEELYKKLTIPTDEISNFKTAVREFNISDLTQRMEAYLERLKNLNAKLATLKDDLKELEALKDGLKEIEIRKYGERGTLVALIRRAKELISLNDREPAQVRELDTFIHSATDQLKRFDAANEALDASFSTLLSIVINAYDAFFENEQRSIDKNPTDGGRDWEITWVNYSLLEILCSKLKGKLLSSSSVGHDAIDFLETKLRTTKLKIFDNLPEIKSKLQVIQADIIVVPINPIETKQERLSEEPRPVLRIVENQAEQLLEASPKIPPHEVERIEPLGAVIDLEKEKKLASEAAPEPPQEIERIEPSGAATDPEKEEKLASQVEMDMRRVRLAMQPSSLSQSADPKQFAVEKRRQQLFLSNEVIDFSSYLVNLYNSDGNRSSGDVSNDRQTSYARIVYQGYKTNSETSKIGIIGLIKDSKDEISHKNMSKEDIALRKFQHALTEREYTRETGKALTKVLLGDNEIVDELDGNDIATLVKGHADLAEKALRPSFFEYLSDWGSISRKFDNNPDAIVNVLLKQPHLADQVFYRGKGISRIWNIFKVDYFAKLEPIHIARMLKEGDFSLVHRILFNPKILEKKLIDNEVLEGIIDKEVLEEIKVTKLAAQLMVGKNLAADAKPSSEVYQQICKWAFDSKPEEPTQDFYDSPLRRLINNEPLFNEVVDNTKETIKRKDGSPINYLHLLLREIKQLNHISNIRNWSNGIFAPNQIWQKLGTYVKFKDLLKTNADIQTQFVRCFSGATGKQAEQELIAVCRALQLINQANLPEGPDKDKIYLDELQKIFDLSGINLATMGLPSKQGSVAPPLALITPPLTPPRSPSFSDPEDDANKRRALPLASNSGTNEDSKLKEEPPSPQASIVNASASLVPK